MKMMIPASTACLLVVTMWVASYVVTGQISVFVWLMTAAAVGAFVWLKNHQIDNPEPVIYKLKAFGVWGQIDTYLRKSQNEWKNVSINIFSVPEPPPNQPLYVKADVGISHPELRDMIKLVKMLRPDYEDLRSKVTLEAFISPNKDGTTTLQLKWKVKPIFHRITENDIIKEISKGIDEEIKTQTTK